MLRQRSHQTLLLSFMFIGVTVGAYHVKLTAFFPYFGNYLQNELLDIPGDQYNNKCSANLTAYQEGPDESLLLALGCPGVYVPRTLGYTNPLVLIQLAGLAWPKMRPLAGAIIIAMQYVFALAATANVIETSWRLGLRTVVTWKCNSNYLPFMWSSLARAVHLVAVVAWYFSRTRRRTWHKVIKTQKPVIKRRCVLGVTAWIKSESSLCVMGKRTGYVDQKSTAKPVFEGWWSMLAFQLAELGVFVHLVFGTLLPSSLMFIATLDAVGVIGRYMASGLVCRVILIFEINGIRRLAEAPEELEMESLRGSSKP